MSANLLVLAAMGAAVSAVHCSSSDDGSGSTCVLANANPTSIRRLTAEQQTLVTQASDRMKGALSAVEWRYLFKLRYVRLPRATVETDPVVVKALTAVAQGTPSCATGATTTSGVDACDRFVNVARCWDNSSVSSATIPCFAWSMMVAGGTGCGVPASPAAAPVDAQAWDDSQDGRETGGCEAPCIAGGGCSNGTCKCASGEEACAGGCAREKSDIYNCGGCGIACPAGTPCVESTCGGPADADAGTDSGTADASDGG